MCASADDYTFEEEAGPKTSSADPPAVEIYEPQQAAPGPPLVCESLCTTLFPVLECLNGPSADSAGWSKPG